MDKNRKKFYKIKYQKNHEIDCENALHIAEKWHFWEINGPKWLRVDWLFWGQN
jgi:hypothetical protein